MASRKLIVEVVGDASSLERTFKRSQAATAGFGAQAGRSFKAFDSSVGVATAGMIAGGGLVAALHASSEAASHLAEMTSKSNVVFGESADVVQDFAKNALGLAEDQALDTASAMGQLFRPMGFTEQAAADLSIQLTKLAVDLSSFSDVPVEEALTALRSALVGEFEPARRLGIVLSAAKVEAEAMAESGKKNAKALTDQEKVLARVNIIMRQTTQAQGDFARTSEGLANQQRTLDANLRDLSATLGKFVNPVLGDFISLMNDAAEGADDLKGALDGLPDKLPDWLPGGGGGGGDKGGSTLGDLFAGNLFRQIRSGIQSFKDVWMPEGLPTAFGMVGAESGDEFVRGFYNAAREGFTHRGEVIPPALVETLTPRKQPGIATPWIDLQLAIADSTKALQDNLRWTRRAIAVLRGRLANAGTLKAQTAIQRQLNQYLADEAAILGEIADKNQAAADAARERQKAAAEARVAARAAALAARDTRQFRTLGLGPGGAELVPNVASLKKTWQRLMGSIRGTDVDTPANRAKLREIWKVLLDPTGVGVNVRSWVDDFFDTIDESIKDRGKKTRLLFRKTTTKALTEGLGLTAAQRRALRGRLGATGPGGTVPVGQSVAFAGAGARGTTINGGVHLHGVQNLRQLENELAKRQRSRPQTRRGAR